MRPISQDEAIKVASGSVVYRYSLRFVEGNPVWGFFDNDDVGQLKCSGYGFVALATTMDSRPRHLSRSREHSAGPFYKYVDVYLFLW